LLSRGIGALMVARVAFGGDLSTQAVVGLLAILTIGSLIMAYINIKRLQLDQHRAWMLRAWVYVGIFQNLCHFSTDLHSLDVFSRHD
jgi:uncharacterized membrane protein YozB (DUF420 family)